MAQIVCIDTGTKRDNNEIGDIISIHEDDVQLTGVGYDNLNVVKVEGISAVELNTIIATKVPQQQIVYKSNSTVWSNIPPEEKETWKDTDGMWNFLESRPKYQMTAIDIVSGDEASLKDAKVMREQKLLLLDKLKEKISLNVNNLTKVSDLNI